MQACGIQKGVLMEKQIEILSNAIYEMDNRGYAQLVHAYLKKVNKPLDETRDYLVKYTQEQFCEKLKEHYDIKGKVDHLKIAKAKIKNDNAVPLEKDEQKAFIKWLREQNKTKPKENQWKITASGNGFVLGSDSNYKYMASLKAQGLDVGELDVKICPGKGLTIYVEMKRIRGSKVSPEQQERVDWYNANGYPSKICYGADMAIEFVNEIIKNYHFT